MRQTLVRIPIDGPWSLGPLGDVPGFGFGVLLAFWMVFGAFWLYRHRRDPGGFGTLLTPCVTWGLVAVAIMFAPSIVHWWKGLDAALAQTNRLLAIDPRSVDALLQRAEIRLKMRDYAGAVADLQAAVAVDPQDAAALDRLARIQATCPDAKIRNGTAAFENARTACELSSSSNPEYLATFAAACAERGDFTQAVKTQRDALRLMAARYAAQPDDERLMAGIAQMRRQMEVFEHDRPYRDRTAGTDLPIFGFGAMLFLGFLAAAWTAGRRGLRVGYSPELMWDIGIWLFIAGVIGCRIFYCIQYGSRLFYKFEGGQYVLKNFRELAFAVIDLPDGGLVYYGGIPAAALVAVWICRRRHLNFLELGDVVIPSLFLGMGFGRIGCFLNGCCYGDRCTLPWGVHFPMGSVPDTALLMRGYIGVDQDMPFLLHPTQLYSALDGFFLFLLTHAYFSYRPRNGAVIALGALTYPLTRFAVESLRGDELGQFNTSLTISQWISIIMFGFGLVFAAWLSRRPKLSLPNLSRPAPTKSVASTA